MHSPDILQNAETTIYMVYTNKTFRFRPKLVHIDNIYFEIDAWFCNRKRHEKSSLR